ncbi:MAG: Cell division protein FtsI [Verrucomicrobiota bacterium]|jgi:penicillin-binding protein 2
MLIFDQLKKNDAPLRLLSLAVVAGLLVLGGGLWWVQVVRGRDYQQKLQNQSYRTVRVPAPRGQILDRNHVPLAENQPSFNLSLYLEELSRDFKSNYNAAVSPYVKAGKKLKPAQRKEIAERTRYAVANNAVTRIANEINEPLPLDYTNFQKHFAQDLALPLPVLQNLTPNQIARVSEAADMPKGLDLEVQSVRVYPNATSSGHLLGYVRRDDSAADGESSYFSHYLPDWRGKTGIENNFDVQLRGTAGEKAVLVNNLGYRQSETIITPVEPGSNVVLTVDLDIQRAAENALASYGAQTRGAAVVMDVNTGDLLALASSPMLDSNEFARPISPQRWEQLSDERLRPQLNRAMHENYSPGSIFKPVIAMAALESGMNPAEQYFLQPDPNPSAKRAGQNKGCIFVGKRKIEDVNASGYYNFKRAFIHSSNGYFITNGLRAGMDNIEKLAAKLHFGQRTRLGLGGEKFQHEETPGNFPTPERIKRGWAPGDTANVCIGQGEVSVTPLQMAVMTAAIANGGKVLWPRIVDSVEPQSFVGGARLVYPTAQVRDTLGVSRRTLDILRDAMLADVEDAEGTGKESRIPGYRIGGKTGTAEIQNQRGDNTDRTTWFISFAPYEAPRYAVVVMVESGSSGGGTCAPLAKEIYLALQKRDQPKLKPQTLARNE